ncbi:hypothetical protein SAMN04488065_0451 [Haloplanus vescus]|uniref:Uncharacterized protein n=1 Tax=Haloplanus vescus TaxID=555874 RepID=A0A1H3W2E5_9EURY|nr:hypothetical protein [Haloplanus vescus]SDZ80492.1 hypothetical protein SAMN04488065_0451 [Haloplanus vescus]
MSRSPVRAAADRLAAVDRLSTAQRAILGYYAETGRFDYRALRIKSAVDDTLDEILDDVYAEIASEIAADLGVDEVEFSYETKLTLPAELTLGYLYRRALARSTDGYDPITDESGGWLSRGDADADANREAREYVEAAEEATALIVQALLDGDMRDAINDDEFEDFEVRVAGESDPDPRRVAECAQSHLQRVVEAAFDRAPDAVRDAYDDAVDISEAHQDQDDHFRVLFDNALDGDEDARQAIEDEYKFAAMPADAPFDEGERDLPYLKTQYDRVGVIYKGMLDAYRGIGFEIPEAFGTSIVLAIIGAQIWLDDVDDYRDDVEEGQLTPVTAEYVLAPSDEAAYENVVDIATEYFDLARAHADEADSPLNGIAIEYILRSGDPTRLPGSD